MLTQYFYHKITGLPLTDPLVTASVTLANMNSDTKVLDNAPMTASVSFPGAFRHTYSIDTEIDYMAYYSCSDSSYVASVDKLFIQARSVWGGGSINLSGVTWSISNLNTSLTKKIEEEHNKTRTLIETKDNETNYHIEVAKDTIITTIGSIETDVDLTAVTEGIGVLKQRFTKLSEWLKTEQKKEIDSKDKENEGKISELQKKIDEMEEAFEEMEGLKWSELKEKQNLIDDMEKTAQEIMEELEKEKIVNKEATEKEIKDKLISSLSE